MRFPYRALMHPRYAATALLIGLWWLVSQLPHRALVGLAWVFAWFTRTFAKRRCYIVQTNLALCFPELTQQQRHALFKRNIFHTCLGGLEIGMVWFWSKRRLRGFGTLHGLHHLTDLDGGALMLSLHNTTVDTASAVINPRVSNSDMMYRPHKNPVYEFVQMWGRQRHNGVSRCIDRADVRGAIRTMRKGRWLWYAPDQDYGIKQGVFAKFFGLPAASVTATARFARSAKVAVVPMVHYRDENLRWQVEFQPPLTDFPSGDDVADAQTVNDWVEAQIRQRPEQYLWVHRRFKTRPPGTLGLYGKYSKKAQKKP